MQFLPRLLLAATFAPSLAFAHHDESAAPTQSSPRFTTSRTSRIDLPLPEEKDAFAFVVYGDRTGGPAEGIKILAQAVEETNLLAPDLVMTVGDLVQGYNDTPKWMMQMREFKSTMQKLDCPWFPVVGNHDIYWRGQGAKPAGEHEADFEANFGPLWYAFEHKRSWFIALYSDEGDPLTGEKAFDKPECQRMSPTQFAWLQSALDRAKGAEHVFLFLHHPRWLGGGYGDDWERVHQLLKSAGNVSAVFAGHIHHMRYDGNRDGIEYFALATVGADQTAIAAQAGYLHEFHVVTVRKDRVAVATIPVGTVMDTREVTGRLSDEVAALSRALPTSLAQGLAFDAELAVHGKLTVEFTNPTQHPAEILLEGSSADSRWSFTPDHTHATLKPGEKRTVSIEVQRAGHAVDAALRLPELVVRADYLGDALRVPLPERRLAIAVDTTNVPEPAAATTPERALVLDGRDECLKIESNALSIPDGPFTVEGWLQAHRFHAREGFVCKTESSEYGLFVNDGAPVFSVFLDGKYANAKADAKVLTSDAWHHVAGVFDGQEVRLYVDGARVANLAASGTRKTNALPLMIGADVTDNGAPTSFFDGQLDEIRISKTARYSGEHFTPDRRCTTDADTLLLLHMDGDWGPWLPDASGAHRNALKIGTPRVE